jgi:hypothetical protein
MANQADRADQGTDLRPANPVMPRRQPGRTHARACVGQRWPVATLQS